MKPFKPDIINQALRKHLGLSLRAEDIRSYTQLFVDPNLLGGLSNNGKQVVFGRRGSGKTMLLGTLVESFQTHQAPKPRVLPLHFSATGFLVSPLLDTGFEEDKQKAFAYFQNFVDQLTHRLVGCIDQVLDSPTFAGLVSRLDKRRRTAIETRALQMLELVTTGERLWYPRGSWTETEVSSTGLAKGSAVVMEAGVGVSGTGANLRMGADARRVSSRRVRYSSDRVKYLEGQLTVRVSSIKQKLLEVIDLLDLDYLLVMIDEWVALDDAGRSGCPKKLPGYLQLGRQTHQLQYTHSAIRQGPSPGIHSYGKRNGSFPRPAV